LAFFDKRQNYKYARFFLNSFLRFKWVFGLFLQLKTYLLLFVLHVEHVGLAWSMTLSICLVLNYECSCVAMCLLTLCEHTMNMVIVDNLLGLFFKCILILLSLLNSFFFSYAFYCSFYTSCGCYPLSTLVANFVELFY